MRDGGALGPLVNAGRPPCGRRLPRAGGADRDAIGELYACHAPGVYGYIRSIVSDAHEAEDLTQQVFIKVMTVSSSSQRRGDFSSWVLRIARNTAFDSLRRRRRTLLVDPQELTPAAVVPDPEPRRSLEAALASLSRAQRDVILLREVLGFTPHEAALGLGKSSGAVQMLHHRARRAMCEQLVTRQSAPSTRGCAERGR